MINNKKEAKLIEDYGPRGFGTYIMLLTELRQNPDYQCYLGAAKAMARRCKISAKLLKHVIYDSGLFEVEQKEEGVIIVSPYLTRTMKSYDDTVKRNSDSGKKNANNSKRNAKGQFTIADGTIEKKRKEENKTTTEVVEKPTKQLVVNSDINAGEHVESWEIYFDKATQDEEWMAILAINSGISGLFVKHKALVVETFREHIRLQGSETRMQSVADVKAYFANFLRPGTKTHKRVVEQLTAYEQESTQATTNPYETIDPATGERTYFGRIIPTEAPPRPNHNAVWSTELNGWI